MSPKTDDVVEISGTADTTPATDVYEVEINGVKTRMKLNATDAKRYGVAKAQTSAKNKARSTKSTKTKKAATAKAAAKTESKTS